MVYLCLFITETSAPPSLQVQTGDGPTLTPVSLRCSDAADLTYQPKSREPPSTPLPLGVRTETTLLDSAKITSRGNPYKRATDLC